MVRLIAFALWSVLLLGGAVSAPDCNLKQVASLPMLNRDGGVVVVSADIAGGSHPFLVDTGGFHSELYSDVVEKLGLTTLPLPPTVEIYDLSGNVSKRYVKIPHFALGSVQGDNWIMVVANRGTGEKTFDGVLGPDVLRNFDVDLDFAAQKLNLMSPEHCDGHVVYWARDYADAEFTLTDEHIVLPMTLDGHEVQATLDTGAGVSTISQGVAARLFKIDPSSPGVEVDPETGANALLRHRYRFKSLSIGGLGVNNPLLYLIPDLARRSFDKRHLDKLDFDPVRGARLNDMQLLLGMNVLSKLHLYIAYKERKIYLTAANEH